MNSEAAAIKPEVAQKEAARSHPAGKSVSFLPVTQQTPVMYSLINSRSSTPDSLNRFVYVFVSCLFTIWIKIIPKILRNTNASLDIVARHIDHFVIVTL